MRIELRKSALCWMLLALVTTWCAPAIYAGNNQVMGELEFKGKSKVEKTSGVWIDGQYVGYLKELNGSKKVLLLPGEHVISVRQDGYQDFTQHVVLQPGEKKTLFVFMQKGVTGVMPAVTSTVKISVNPSRAAVFLDGLFVGHVGEFEGAGRGMLVAPGTHTIRIALPGYRTFETQISPAPKQKVEVKTDLLKDDSNPVEDPMIKPSASNGAASGVPAVPNPPAAPTAPATYSTPAPAAPRPAAGTAAAPAPPTAPVSSNYPAPAPRTMQPVAPAPTATPGVPGAPASDNGPPPPPEPANPSSPQ